MLLFILAACVSLSPAVEPPSAPRATAPAAKPPPRPRPNAALVAKLRRGVNLSHRWQEEAGGPGSKLTAEEMSALKQAGFTHVRVPIDPVRLMDGKEKLNQGLVSDLLNAVNELTRAGLAVVIDAHACGNGATSMQPAKSPAEWEKELTAFWDLFAPVWKRTPPDAVALELLSEPSGIDDKAWGEAQLRLLATVRRHLPRHTVVLTGADWGGIDGLTRLTPATDANTVYSIHFYEPHTFTHQQATWGSPLWKEIKGLSYPFEQQNLDAVLAATASAKAQAALRWYAKEKWSATTISLRFDRAAAWAREHNAVVYLGEFGAYRDGGDERSRCEWLKDVRQAAENAGFGWCVWDYSGGYAVSSTRGGARTLDEAAARALGLASPASPPRKRP